MKLRKGKRYGFTDPEGNADRLFVFHRDVEKARERLKQGDPPASQQLGCKKGPYTSMARGFSPAFAGLKACATTGL